MIRYLGFAAVVGLLAAALLLQLTQTVELVAWEILIVLLLIVLMRLFPRSNAGPIPALFGGKRGEVSHAPRSVATFELAAVHALSESAGADRRMKTQMRRIAQHRLRRRGVRPGSPAAVRLIDPVLFDDRVQPLTRIQIERIIDQLERL